MAAETHGMAFPPTSCRSPAMHAYETQMSPCMQMAQTQEESGAGEGPLSFQQREDALYGPKSISAEKYRRHSTDGVTGPCLVELGRFHPYRRQYSADAGDPRSPPHCPPPGFGCFEGLEISETLEQESRQICPPEVTVSWANVGLYSAGQHSARLTGAPAKYPDIPPAPGEAKLKPPGYPSHLQPTFGPASSLPQFPTGRVYPGMGASGTTHYGFPCSSPQCSQDAQQTLYPKPIYSYSILIFMALRNSRTGSLPVSEIYNFMTEHFPYFKTAPDGWKNSVRHNLSLNKCFEKVENKTSSSSRKGCLWALNPSKVEKMQEELHKWRRKDPVTVRKSMARPEELDRLLGDKPEKFKALSAPPPPAGSFGHRLLTREAGSFEMPPSYGAARPGTANPALRCPPQGRPIRQQPPYLPPATPAFSYFSPGIPPGTGSLDSPVPVQSPPAPGAALLAEHCASRSMQELLLEGELSNDIDTLNPSLTDLQLHGNLWEELKDDSLALDSLVVIATLPSSPFPDHAQDGFSSVGREPSVPSAEEEEEEGNLADVCITGIYSTAFSNLEHVSYLSAPTGTAIPLL